jgi:hypothetical protein
MALTIIHSPTKYNFSRNFIYVEIDTDNSTESFNYGLKASCYFTALHLAVINDTLTVDIGGGVTQVLTFKAATNIAAHEIAVISGGMSNNDYIAQLANEIGTHAAISPVLDVASYQNSLHFTAKNAGPTYDFLLSTTDVVGAGFYREDGTDDIQTRPRPNYRLVLELYCWNGVSWDLVTTVEKTPANGKIQCDLSWYIDNQLDYDFPTDVSDGSALECLNVLKKFYVKILEYYGTPAVTHAAVISPGAVMANATDTIDFWVLKAGFDRASALAMPDEQFDYYFQNPALPVGIHAFLTRQPRTKKIPRTGHYEHLYFLFNNAVANTVALVHTYYDSQGNVVGTANACTTPVAPGAKSVWCFAANPSGSAFWTNTNVVKMEAVLKNTFTSATLSETMTYLVDEYVPLEENAIYFPNSDGGMDVVRCLGVKEVAPDFDRGINERTATPFDTDLDGNMEQNYVQKTTNGQIHSGWRTKKELEYIEELMMSKGGFFWRNAHLDAIRVPIIILNKTYTPHKTKVHLHGYLIEYREAFTSPVSSARIHPLV